MRKRELRALRLQAAKRQPFEIAANDETTITWGDFYAEVIDTEHATKPENHDDTDTRRNECS